MALTLTQLEDYLQTFLRTQAGLSGTLVIWEEQALAKRPAAGLYLGLTWALLGTPEGGTDELRVAEVAGSDKTVGLRRSTLTVNAYRAGARQKLLDLQAVCRDAEAKTYFKGKDCSIVSVGQVQEISKVLDDWEERAALDIEVYWTSERTQDLGTIETVVYNGQNLSLV